MDPMITDPNALHAAKSLGLRLKGVGYIFYTALYIDVRKIKDRKKKS